MDEIDLEDWQSALRERLLEDAGLWAVLSDYSDTKGLFWVQAPQRATLTHITLQTIADGQEQHLKGYQSLQEKRVQVDVRATIHKAAWRAARAFLAAAVPSWAGNGHRFGRASIELQPRDLADAAADGSTVFRVSMDLIFNHSTL